MFEIMTNNNLRINGGDTAAFEITLQSAGCNSKVKKFTGVNTSLTDSNMTNVKSIVIDRLAWYNSDRAPGEYKFLLQENSWLLNGTPVNLLQYNIYIDQLSELNVGDYFTISYTKGDSNSLMKDGSYVTLQVMQQNTPPGSPPLFLKQFYTSGKVVKIDYRQCSESPKYTITTNIDNISEDGNFKITFDKKDTECLPYNTYVYLLQANYVENGKQQQVQIGNKHYLYVINDDFAGRAWNSYNTSITGYTNQGYKLAITASDIQAVSYGEKQDLKVSEQEIARQNIKAITTSDVDVMLEDLNIDELQQTPGVDLIFNDND